MASDIFIDTSGFYACLVAQDDAHAAAAAVLARYRGRRRFVTTDYVLDEVATLLRARRLGHLVEPAFRLTLASSACRVEWMDPTRFGSARAYLSRHGADHAYSFTDCASFCTMAELGLRDALTKDVHFRQAGFRPLLAP
jgi:predicted nucleic acid-binding protein